MERPLEERLSEVEDKLLKLEGQAQQAKEQRTVQRAILGLALFAALILPQRVPRWAEQGLQLATTAGVGLALFGNKKELLDFLNQKI